jgi:hypothetical protein
LYNSDFEPNTDFNRRTILEQAGLLPDLGQPPLNVHSEPNLEPPSGAQARLEFISLKIDEREDWMRFSWRFAYGLTSSLNRFILVLENMKAAGYMKDIIIYRSLKHRSL